MSLKLLRSPLRLKTLLREDAQDLVEYALVVALIGFALTAGMKTFAGKISNTLINFGTALTNT